MIQRYAAMANLRTANAITLPTVSLVKDDMGGLVLHRDHEAELEKVKGALRKCWRYLDRGNPTEMWSNCPVCHANWQVGQPPLKHEPDCWYGAALNGEDAP